MNEPAQKTAAVFAALADVVRLQIMEALRYRKAAPRGRRTLTTGELTKITGTRSLAGHLRVLKDAGLIRIVGEALRTKTEWELIGDPEQPLVAWDEEAAADPTKPIRSLERATTYRCIDRMRRFDDEVRESAWPKEWADAAVGRDYLLALTPSDLEKFDADFADLMEGLKEISRSNRANAVDGTRPVFTSARGFPVRLGEEDQ